MSGRPAARSLTSRLALAMALVAVVSTVLAGALAAPLLRSATDDAVREPLGRQADLLARLPRAALFANRVEKITRAQDLSVGVLTRTGAARGAALALSAEDRAALLRGRPVSATRRLGGAQVLVEARPARTGGAVVLAASSDSVAAASARLRGRVLLALGVGLVAALLAALLVARRLGEPLARTAAAARRLAAGHRGVPLPDGTGQVAEVADVSDALRHLDRALTLSEQRQRTFLLSVSHELRTPLTTVRGYAEAIADGAVDGDELPEVGRTLVAEARRLQSYVDELLALARLEADDFALHFEPVDLGRLLADAATAWQPRAGQAGVTIGTDLPGRPLVADTDPARLRQVVDALTDNAVRVCGRGDRVVLGARRTPEGVVVEVRDSGPGLSEADAAVAFQPGVLHQRHAARAGGAGLGLAIVQRLVERLGGRVAVGRSPEGGAAFCLTLAGTPAQPPAGRRSPAPPAGSPGPLPPR